MVNLAQRHKSVSSGLVRFLKSILARFVLKVDADEAAAALAKDVERKAKEAARSKARRDARKQRNDDCSQPEIPTADSHHESAVATADSAKTPEISASALSSLPAKTRLSLLKNLSLKERESGRIGLPRDWGPDDATRKFAIEHLGDEAAVDHCLTKFRIHHETSGEERTPKQWQSRARGWVLKEKQLFGRQLSLRLLAPVPKAKPIGYDPARYGWRPGLPTDEEMRKQARGG